VSTIARQGGRHGNVMIARDRQRHSLALVLEGATYLSGWRPEQGTLFLPTFVAGAVGDDVAVRLGITGQTLRVNLSGTIALVRRSGRLSLPPGAEIVLDPSSLPAARFLALASQGKDVEFRDRSSPRFIVNRILNTLWNGAHRECATINVSESGCALVWGAEAPAARDLVTLRVTGGLFGATARAVVCWKGAHDKGEQRLGLSLLGEGRGLRAWRDMVASVAASGARVG